MWLEQVINLFKNKPKCPIRNPDRVVLDNGFFHLIQEFGEEFVLNSKIYSNPIEITGKVFRGDELYTQLLFQKLGDILEVDLRQVELGLFNETGDVFLDSGVMMVSENGGEFASSKFTEYSDGSAEILINSRYIKDFCCLVVSIAFELIRLKLRREGKEYADDDVILELVLLFFGLGVFNANSSVAKMKTWSGDLSSGWNIEKGPSQLSPEAHGYILALFASYRGENNPAWADSLEKEVKKVFYEGLRYLKVR